MQNLIVSACHKGYDALPMSERRAIRKPEFEMQEQASTSLPNGSVGGGDHSGFNDLIQALVGANSSAGGLSSTSTDYHELGGSHGATTSTDIHNISGMHDGDGTSSDPHHAFVSTTPHSAVFLDETHGGLVPEYDRAFRERSSMTGMTLAGEQRAAEVQGWSERLDHAIAMVADRLSRPADTAVTGPSPFGAVDMSELSELVATPGTTPPPEVAVVMVEEEEEEGTVFSLEDLQELSEEEEVDQPAQRTML